MRRGIVPDVSTETQQPKPTESVFLRVPQTLAEAIRAAIDAENAARSRRRPLRRPLFMRKSKHNLIGWILRAGDRELRRAERGPRGRQIAGPPEEKKDVVTIARQIEIDRATAERVRAAVLAINGRRREAGKPPVCLYMGRPSLPAFYLRAAQRELRRLAREAEKRAAA